MTNAQAMADYESGYLRGQHDADKRIVRRCTEEVDGKYFTMGYRQAFRDANIRVVKSRA